jgi:hypothetical protein
MIGEKHIWRRLHEADGVIDIRYDEWKLRDRLQKMVNEGLLTMEAYNSGYGCTLHDRRFQYSLTEKGQAYMDYTKI